MGQYPNRLQMFLSTSEIKFDKILNLEEVQYCSPSFYAKKNKLTVEKSLTLLTFRDLTGYYLMRFIFRFKK